MRKLIGVAVLVFLGFVVAGPAAAQARFGVQADWGDKTDFGLGARLGFPLGGELKKNGIEGLAAFDFFFPKAGDYWELSGNGLYHIATSSTTKPYVGAGLLLAHSSGSRPLGTTFSDTRLGLNLLGGIRFKAQERLLPFIEGRLSIRDGSQFVIAGGVYFGKS